MKRSVLGVTAESVVSEEAAREMAEGAQRVLGADVGIAVTGVAGPTEQDGVAVGTVCFGIALPGRPTEAVSDPAPGRPRAAAPVLDDLAAEPAAPALDVLAHERNGLSSWRSRSTSTAPTSTGWSTFYCAALGYVPHGSSGGDRTGRSCPPTGDGPKLVFQKVPEAKVAKNRCTST